MTRQPARVARVDRRELSSIPSDWSFPRRGRYLRLLLQGKGIDPERYYRVEYHPRRHCWVLTQEEGRKPRPVAPGARADEVLFVQAMTIFRRTAVAAYAALAAQSPHFARRGRVYRPPTGSQETTLDELIRLLGGGAGDPPVTFDSEGGWQDCPSEN